MVILEIDGERYGGQSYVEGDWSYPDHQENVRKLAQEVAETVFIHFGYGIEDIQVNAQLFIQIEDENTKEETE